MGSDDLPKTSKSIGKAASARQFIDDEEDNRFAFDDDDNDYGYYGNYNDNDSDNELAFSLKHYFHYVRIFIPEFCLFSNFCLFWYLIY